jgi:hypothetical protein
MTTRARLTVDILDSHNHVVPYIYSHGCMKSCSGLISCPSFSRNICTSILLLFSINRYIKFIMISLAVLTSYVYRDSHGKSGEKKDNL